MSYGIQVKLHGNYGGKLKMNQRDKFWKSKNVFITGATGSVGS